MSTSGVHESLVSKRKFIEMEPSRTPGRPAPSLVIQHRVRLQVTNRNSVLSLPLIVGLSLCTGVYRLHLFDSPGACEAGPLTRCRRSHYADRGGTFLLR